MDRKYTVLETSTVMVMGGFCLSFPMMLISWIVESKDIFWYGLGQCGLCGLSLLVLVVSCFMEVKEWINDSSKT